MAVWIDFVWARKISKRIPRRVKIRVNFSALVVILFETLLCLCLLGGVLIRLFDRRIY